MSSLIISSVTALAYTSAGASSPPTGAFYPTPKFGLGSPPWFSDPDIPMAKHFIPGIGYGTTEIGDFGISLIHADIIFVDISAAAAEARFVTALNVFKARARFNITCRGKNFTGCKLVKNSTHKIGQDFRGKRSHVVYGFTFEHLG